MEAPAECLIQLSAYMDGELEGAEAGQVTVLLVSNPAVSEEYELLKQVCNTLTAWDEVDCIGIYASPSFVPKLTERLHKYHADKHKSDSGHHSLTSATRN
jgi:hypothetical protein